MASNLRRRKERDAAERSAPAAPAPPTAAGRRGSGTSVPRSQRLSMIASCFTEAGGAEDGRLIHERIRLGILSALSVNSVMSFADLRELLQTTDGNLSRHARKLEDAEYIVCEKTFAGRVPITRYSLTAKGRRAFEKHLEHMDALIHAARGR